MNSSKNVITLKLYVPCKFVPKVRVLPDQKIHIMNNVKVFSSENKMIFISKGMILPYYKSIDECGLSEGDSVFALKINDSIIENLLSTDEDISIAQIRSKVSLFGPCYEANLTSINKNLMHSENPDELKNKILFHSKPTCNEMARIQDIRTMKKENCRKTWRKQISSFISKETDDYNCFESLNINYDAPKEPCCEALPMFL